MTNSTDRGASELESELHRRYSQAFEQYATLTRGFMDQWQKAAGGFAGAAGSLPGMVPTPDIARTLSDWFQRTVLGSAADPAKAWSQWAGLASGLPGAAAPAGGGTPLEQALQQQEQVARRLFELAAQCQRLQTQLAAHWASVGQRTAQNFLGSLQGSADASTDPSQWPQKLYGAWIDMAEKAYQESARGAEYVQLMASLTNAANAFKAEQNRLVELWAKFFDHPTRSELDALQRELRDLRAELRELRRPR